MQETQRDLAARTRDATSQRLYFNSSTQQGNSSQSRRYNQNNQKTERHGRIFLMNWKQLEKIEKIYRLQFK